MVDQVLQPVLLQLEQQRKSIAKAQLIAWSLMGAAAIIFLVAFLSGLVIPWIIAGSALLLAAGVIYYRNLGHLGEYKNAYKEKAVAAAISGVDSKLKFDATDGLCWEEFVSSGLFDREPDRISSEDLVTGCIGKTFFCFSEVHAEYKTTTQTKNGTQVHWHDIFKGVIFTADFNKKLNGFTVIRPRDTGNAIDAWLAKNAPLLSGKGDNLVELENPSFCEHFVTFSTDQVEARYILTPSMMERICELNERCSYTLSASFIQSYMYLAFPLDNNYFEAPVFRSLLDSGALHEDMELIKFMEGIIEDLDLNTRIWGKE